MSKSIPKTLVVCDCGKSFFTFLGGSTECAICLNSKQNESNDLMDALKTCKKDPMELSKIVEALGPNVQFDAFPWTEIHKAGENVYRLNFENQPNYILGAKLEECLRKADIPAEIRMLIISEPDKWFGSDLTYKNFCTWRTRYVKDFLMAKKKVLEAQKEVDLALEYIKDYASNS